MGECKAEKCHNKIWSNGLCLSHIPRKPFKKSILSKTENNVEKLQISEMNKFFLSIWKKRKHYSEVSGEILHSPPSSLYFHHILPKNKYPEICFCEDNIVLLTPNEHLAIENNIYKFEYINKLREQLKIKYKI